MLSLVIGCRMSLAVFPLHHVDLRQFIFVSFILITVEPLEHVLNFGGTQVVAVALAINA